MYNTQKIGQALLIENLSLMSGQISNKITHIRKNMTLDVYLSIFTLILFSLGINILSLKTRIPYTVLLVIGGSLLVPLANIEAFSFVTSFQLTPELLFFVFLPILIFESAYNMKIRNIQENKFAISMLAIVGLLISTFFIGYVGRWAFGLLGFDIPLLVTLLFGAIISATDPVAVLSLGMCMK